jgi:diguanylate cyclase (GGDEF)-like protein
MSDSPSTSHSSVTFQTNGWMAGLLVFLLAAILSAAVIWHFEEIRLSDTHHEIKNTAVDNANRLRNTIDHKLALTYPLAAMIQQNGTIDDFESIGKKLIKFFPYISEIALVPDGIIKQVVPILGNEKALGFNLFTDPEQQKEALFARETGELTLAGPLHLVQGGEGIVGRLPVFTKEKKFWGFVLVVIRFPDVLNTTSLGKLKKEGYQYTLTRINPQTKKEQIIASSGSKKLSRPVEQSIDLPNSQWMLRIAPINGWYNPWLLALETAIAILFSTLLGYIAKQYTELQNYRNSLEKLVDQRTAMYATLSHCNRAIAHSATPNELFAEICKSTVAQGGMNMAWIGLIDPLTKRINPVASYGDGKHYLEGIEISTQADLPNGKGPTGTSVRKNRPYWCQDFMNDPSTAPWHDRAKEIGWKSSAALPIHLYDNVIGVFTIYSQALNAFDPLSQELLIEMAMDISFAMENFDRETKRRAAEAHLVQTEKLLEEMSSMAHIGGWEFNPASGEGTWTKEVALIHDLDMSCTATMTLGLSVYEGEWLEKIETALHEAIHKKIPYDLILLMKTAKGNQKWVRTIGSPVIENGEVVRIRSSMQDITVQKNAEEKVQWLAHFDSLTGLPNRVLLNDRVQYAISIAHHSEDSIALLFLDMDHFKNINDSLGHSIGDDLLVKVSKRIQSVLREADTLSRQWGDEFFIVLSATDADDAAHIAEKLIEVISQPYYIQHHELTVTPSIGIALYPMDGTNFEMLLQSANAAMYRAKHDGRNCYRFVLPEIQARSARNLELENGLRHALSRNELELYYQPQILIETGDIIGAEALLRWKHPTLGMVSPAEFIPVAEESGQIVAIGEWVLHSALKQLKSWIDGGIEPFIMSVNLSAVQFRHPKLASLILDTLKEIELPAKYLELELTEGIAMENPLRAIEIMNELHDQGIRMSIDDFGTGYSSLNYLKKFKVYKLKIDQSFIHDITENPEDKTIVNTIIYMAHSLNMITIAEGVETAEQFDILREIGCKEVQGYYFSKPLPYDEFKQFIDSKTIAHTSA